MNNVGVDTANLAAMPLEDLEALAGPVVAALKERKAQAAKEGRLRKRKEPIRSRAWLGSQQH